MYTDPIADMLTRIRNANIVSHPEVEIPGSKLKLELAKVLKEEGYIADYKEKESGKFKVLSITLKYDENNKPVISNLKRVSKMSLKALSLASLRICHLFIAFNVHDMNVYFKWFKCHHCCE